MNAPEVGKLITSEAFRDAIHVAVAPVVGDTVLHPGDRIGFVEQGNTSKVSIHCKETIGIVDPFLKESVRPGERFWMFLYPNTITSLRHVFTHPAFQVKVPGAKS